jgi:hypothetical protein
MSVTIVVSLLLVCGVSIAVYIASTGVPRASEALELPLRDLMAFEERAAFLLITRSFDRRFLQFKKYRYGSAQGVELGFPNAKWSAPYFQRVTDECVRRGLDWKVARVGEARMEFLLVRFENAKLAAELARWILHSVFGCPESIKFRVRIELGAG